MSDRNGFKTVWHWRELLKAVGLVFAVGLLWGAACHLMMLSSTVVTLVGMTLGCGATLFAMRLWDLYHFERRKL